MRRFGIPPPPINDNPFLEKRSEPRHEVQLAGELIWNGGAKRQRCTIRDMSVSGARVDTGFFVRVPENSFLLDRDTGNLFECQVKWQQGSQIGLFFIDVGSRSARKSMIDGHARSG